MSVRIHPSEYLKLEAYFLDLATRRSVEKLTAEFQWIPFEPYAPVRRQLLNILRAVNRERKRAGYEVVPNKALRLRRSMAEPFGVYHSSERSVAGNSGAQPGHVLAFCVTPNAPR